MFNSLMLEIAITRSQISKRDLAKKLGISEQGLYNKLNGISEYPHTGYNAGCEAKRRGDDI